MFISFLKTIKSCSKLFKERKVDIKTIGLVTKLGSETYFDNIIICLVFRTSATQTQRAF